MADAAAPGVTDLSALISVVIPAYNRAAAVGAAIESVVRQEVSSTEGAVEIIVVDDASDDDLAAALRPFNQAVRLIRHDRNNGAAAARNTGIAAANGDFLAFLDSDDTWLPGKLTRQVAAMRQRGWHASCTAYLLARPGLRDLVSPDLPTSTLGVERMVWGCFVSPGSTLLCRRSLFAEIGPFDTALERLEDWDWLLRLVRVRPLGFIGEPLARIEPSSGGSAAKVIPALDRLWRTHAPELTAPMRRHFAAALDIERAAAFYRGGDRSSAAASLLRSLLRVPFGNRALAAVLHNRMARAA
jgi:glycosyltransferase involved in cell wall biosynthesis